MLSIFKSNSQDRFFGNYKKPETLIKLEDFQKNKKLSWEYLGFYISYDHHYSMTPIDVIPFAGTGGDGIHFGFLTDFGNVKDLNNAPIVAVHPGDDPPIRLIASNIREFLRIVVSIEEAELIVNDFEKEEDLIKRKKDWFKVQTTDWEGNPLPEREVKENEKRHQESLNKRQELIKILKTEFGIEPKTDIVNSIKTLKELRSKQVSINTLDGLGIIGNKNVEISEFDYTEKDTVKLKDFIRTSNLPSRLKLYRDATFAYILSSGYDVSFKDILVEGLLRDNFNREAEILKKY